MYVSICYKDYTDKLNNITIKYGYYFKTYHEQACYNRNIEDIHIYKDNNCSEKIIPSPIFHRHFMKLKNSYAIKFLNEPRIFLGFKLKPKPEKSCYTISFDRCLIEELLLLNINIFCKLRLVEEMDKTLLYPYKHMIISNLDNLKELYKLKNRDLFTKAIENSGTIFEDIYNTCKDIYKHVDEIDLEEQSKKEQILFNKNEEIINLSRSFFKDLNRISSKSR